MAGPESPLPIEALAAPLFGEKEGRRRVLPALAGALFLFGLGLFGLWALAGRQVARAPECVHARSFLGSSPRLARFLGRPIRVEERPLRFRYEGEVCRMVFAVRGPRRGGKARVDVRLGAEPELRAARFERWNLLPGKPLNAPQEGK